MRPAGRVVLVFALVAGLVWIGQGAGLIRGSFMTGDPTWAAIGAVVSGVAALLLWRSLRRKVP